MKMLSNLLGLKIVIIWAFWSFISQNSAFSQTIQPMQNRMFSASVCQRDTVVVAIRSNNTPSLDSLSMALLIDTNLFVWIGFNQVHSFINSASIQVGLGNPLRLSFHSNPGDTVALGTHTWLQLLLVPKQAGILSIPWDTAGSVTLDSIGQPYEAVQWFNGALTVNPVLRTLDIRFICEGDSSVFGGISYFVSGTYYDTLQSTFGCDSITELRLTVLSDSVVRASRGICSNGTIFWGGITINQPGLYIDTLVNAAGCDSIIHLTVNLLPNSSYDLFDTLCANQIYIFLGDTITNSGIYPRIVTAFNGCDSTVVLHLHVIPVRGTNLNASVCQGSPFNFGGSPVSTSLPGLFLISDTLLSGLGCDSIVNMSLRIWPTNSDTTRAEICDGDTYTFNNMNLFTTGVYRDTLVNQFGCDSFRVLILSVRPQGRRILSDTLCPGQSISFGNTTISLPGLYSDTLTNQFGCDSIVQLTLVGGIRDTSSLTASICQGSSYLFNGLSLTSAGVYNSVFVNRWGCDSLVYLTLTVAPSYLLVFHDTLCAGDTLYLGNMPITQSGLYTDSLRSSSGCDSLIRRNVFFRPLPSSVQNLSICAGDTLWINGTPYFSATSVLDTIPGSLCDSLVGYHIAVDTFPTRYIYLTLCPGQSYTWNGLVLNQAGLYYDTLNVPNGCDSLLVLQLYYVTPRSIQTSQRICQGDSVWWGSVYLFTSGIYRDTVRSYLGCDSLWLSLQLNVHIPFRDSLSDTVCFNEPYIFGSDTLRQSGIYSDTVAGVSGCDSIHVLFLHVRPSVDTTIHVTYPFGTYYQVGNYAFNTTGRFVVRFPLSNGCDSTVTLNLLIEPPIFGGSGGIRPGFCNGGGNCGPGCGYRPYTTVIEDVYGCIGDTVEVPVWIYNSTGVAAITHTINLDSNKVRFVGVSSILPNINNGSIAFNATTFSTPNGSRYQFRFAWFDTTALSFGAAVLYKVRLLIIDSARSDLAWDLLNSGQCEYGNLAGSPIARAIWYNGLSHGGVRLFKREASLCPGQSYQFYGRSLSTSGVYVQNVRSSVAGCDSLIYLNLWVNDSIGRQLSWVICSGDRVSFNGNNNIQTPGIYHYRGISYLGCDSLVSMTLSVLQNSSHTIYDTVPFGTLYRVGPFFFDRPGTYTTILRSANGCDSVLTLHIVFSSNGRIITSVGGNYGSVGDTVLVPVTITNRTVFSGFSYFIDFDSSLLHFVGLDSVASVFAGALRCVDTTRLTPAGIRKNIFVDGNWANLIATTTLNVGYLKFRIMRPGPALLSWVIDSNSGSKYRDLTGNYLDSCIWVNGWVYGGATHRLVNDTICRGSNYQFGIQSLDSSGIYMSSQFSATMGDSLTTLKLIVLDNPDSLEISLNSTRDSLKLTGIYSSVSWYRDSILQPFYGNTMPILRSGSHAYYAIGHSTLCGDDTSNVMVWPSASVREQLSSRAGAWILYPNPNSGRMYLRKKDDGCHGTWRLSIRDHAGKKVFERSIQAFENQCEIELDAENLKPSVYILTIMDDQHAIWHEKVIIQ